MPHYFSEQQEGPVKFNEISAIARNKRFTLVVASGVFSPKKLDIGSKLLIEKCLIPPSGEILDLGCGYGAVGVILAKTNPSLKFTLVDINRRAVLCAKKNINLQKLDNATAKWGDLYQGLGYFDSILCNPPQTAGKMLCMQIIDEAPAHLTKGGMLQLVVRHQKGGKSLREEMEKVFGNVIDIAKGSGYRIYLSKH
ncbi:MAG: methyltransferase [Nanoarchaeota archaeon]